MKFSFSLDFYFYLVLKNLAKHTSREISQNEVLRKLRYHPTFTPFSLALKTNTYDFFACIHPTP
jgi:hypothetical protein